MLRICLPGSASFLPAACGGVWSLSVFESGYKRPAQEQVKCQDGNVWSSPQVNKKIALLLSSTFALYSHRMAIHITSAPLEDSPAPHCIHTEHEMRQGLLKCSPARRIPGCGAINRVR